MTAALDWYPMPDDTQQQRPAWWRDGIASPLTVIALAAMLGAGATLWREAPVSAVQVAATSAEVATLKGEVAALQRAQLALEADTRSNKEQLAQMRDTLNEIKQFNAGIMRETAALNVQFAEIRGGLAKENKRK
jgi:TolA-binding protein